MKFVLFVTLLLAHSQASTFLGNGGQTGDVELAVSLRQVKAALTAIRDRLDTDANSELCYCPEEYSDHHLCETFANLNQEQIKYCNQFLKDQWSATLSSARTTRFEWVNQEMLTESEDESRVVEAVAQRDKNSILIHRNRFVELSPAKRTFLLTHELFHMKPYQGKDLDDEKPMGPFTEKNGVRTLLNAAAAGTVLVSIEDKVFQNYTPTLKKSRSTKTHWLSVSSLSNPLEDRSNTRFKTNLNSGSRWGYSYFFKSPMSFGLSALFSSQAGDKTIYTQTKLAQSQRTTAVGLSARFFPLTHLDVFNTFWNSFIQTDLYLENLSAEISLNDGYTDFKETTSSQSPLLRVSAHIPVGSEFWLFGGIEVSQHNIKYNELSYELKSVQKPNLFLGASYGF